MMNSSNLVLNRWISWTDKSADTAFEESAKDVGNGESKLASEIDGKKNVDKTFDIITSIGEKIEVKEFGSFRTTIESGPALQLRKRIDDITSQLSKALFSVDGEKLKDLDPEFESCIKRVEEISNKVHKDIGIQIVLGKEYGPKAKSKNVVGLFQIISNLYNLYENYISNSENNKKVQIYINDDIIDLDKSLYLKVLDIIGVNSVEEENILDLIYSKLDDRVFKNPNELNVLWTSGSDLVDELFKKADLLAIVDKSKGYIILNKEMLRSYIKFVGFTKGDIKFNLRSSLKKV